jgi:AcrR family transcriptional regulator
MHMSEQRNSKARRPYTLRRRLARQAETRDRITAAAFELHATVGPSKTTVSAIAERAGVQRHTVYHHFPDLDTLYEACTAHGLRSTGVPQPAGWGSIADPAARLAHGLTELYAWYRANERMLSTILGDAATGEPPAEPDLFDRHMGAIFAILADGWRCPDDRRPILSATIGHAMGFETWRSLTRFGLSDDDARNLLVSLVVRVADGTMTDGQADLRPGGSHAPE